jgi:hypothetical protein
MPTSWSTLVARLGCRRRHLAATLAGPKKVKALKIQLVVSLWTGSSLGLIATVNVQFPQQMRKVSTICIVGVALMNLFALLERAIRIPEPFVCHVSCKGRCD